MFRQRNRLFISVTVIGLLGIAELLAHFGLAWIEGGWQSPRARVAYQQSLIQDPSAIPSSKNGAGEADLPPAFGIPVVLHPFAGYVRDPARPNAYYQVAEDGFFAPHDNAPQSVHQAMGRQRTQGEADDPLVVAIFGGSVANHVAFSGAVALRRQIQQATGRDVIVRSLALGGFKQPQQLTTLAYLLARGTHFDVIVNLDGFNELVLPFDNLRAEVDPSYPIHWSKLAGALADSRSHRLLGEVAYLKARRGARAARAAGLLRRYCGTCQLWWRVGDRRLATRLVALETAIAERGAAQRPFQSHGPPIAQRPQAEWLGEQVALWQRASLQMNALARGMGSVYLHALQPNQYLPASKPLSHAERRLAFDEDIHHRRLVEAGYPMMIEAGVELIAQGVAFHDLTGLFHDETSTLYIDPCCHLNRLGNVRIARAIGALIVDAIRGRDN